MKLRRIIVKVTILFVFIQNIILPINFTVGYLYADENKPILDEMLDSSCPSKDHPENKKEDFYFEETQSQYLAGEEFTLIVKTRNVTTEFEISIPLDSKIINDKTSDQAITNTGDGKWVIQSSIPKNLFEIRINIEHSGKHTFSIDEVKHSIEVQEWNDNKDREAAAHNKDQDININEDRNEMNSSIIQEHENYSNQIGLEENSDLKDNKKNQSKVNVIGNPTIKDVASWEEFIKAFSNKEIHTINIIADFETPNNPRIGIENITEGNTDNVPNSERFVRLREASISRKVIIEGNNHQIDFRSIMLGFENRTVSQISPWDIEIKNLTIYHGNWYGPISLVNLSDSNQRTSKMTYYNITNYGNQLLHAPYTDIYIKGTVVNHQVQYYTSKFRENWQIYTTHQANLEVSNVEISENATLDVKTIGAGNIDVLNGGTLTLKKNSTLLAEANGHAGEIEGVNILLRNGNFIVEENARVELKTQNKRGGISLYSSNSKVSIGKNSYVSVVSSGDKDNRNGVWWNAIFMNGGSKFEIDDGGKLHIQGINMGASSSNIIEVQGSADFSVGKDAVIDITSDSTSNNQSIMNFTSSNSKFKFVDAKRINLQRVSEISGTSTENGLIRIAGDSGLLEIDIQTVKMWARGNYNAVHPTYTWTPIFNLNLVYSNFTSRIESVSSINQNIITDFERFFTTQNVQRVLFEKIPDVKVTIDALSEDSVASNSTTITGKSNPFSYIRFSGDSSIPSGSILSPNTSESEKFHTIADHNGDYNYTLPQGLRFSAGNEVTAYAFLNGKDGIASTIVEGKKATPDPIDPINPENEVNPENKPEVPEYQGLLSLDFVSQFVFGEQKISANDKIYYANSQKILNDMGNNYIGSRPNYIQISDRRANNSETGWELSVTQNKQFTDYRGNELLGASIGMTNQQLVTNIGGNSPSLQETDDITLVPNVKHVLLKAQENTGKGTWIYRFGDLETANKSVYLKIPKGSNPDATAYNTNLLWTLSIVP
ncbi:MULTISPECIES: WxL domain-containing protein [unclassified Enterococcus]|uniref:WxL domain-containing protein n=1 Tax=unclassified Enterococcus TaxID=2608891 RepID=UPI001A9117F9|nr:MULTISPECIES: WxL domain-containing protein [unclassified Enterococcus]MBO0462429.1 WxL domain-containing protein [Enterococcus sp. DIV1298c]MBO1301258.1 WxL domain-containing protein [Enterococcus sp. DIV1271a]